MKSVLVTGGAGFIGSHFVEHLFDRHPDVRIVVLDAFTYAASIENIPPRIQESGRFRLLHGDVRHAEIVSDLVADCDAVVHFAAESHVARSIYNNALFFETDVLGTQVVANAVARHASHVERFVHISTSEVYGAAQSDPMDEAHALEPLTPYAAAKAGADRLVHAYRATYGIPAVILRPFNNYGPRQHLEKAIPRFITSALLDEPLRIHGDGRATRDWLFVSDTCDAVERALTAPARDVATGAINLGTGTDASILDIARRVLALTGKPESLIEHVEERPGQVSRHISSTARAEKVLGGWRSRTSLDEGLARTIDWYRANRDWWERQRWMREVRVVDRGGRQSTY